MLTFHLLLYLALVLTVTAQSPAGSCATGVHVIGASGSGFENIGSYSLLGTLVYNITNAINGSDNAILNYDKANPNGLNQTTTGRDLLAQYVANYTAACPNTYIVLAGYSAGAIITLDYICGSQFPWPTVPAQPASLTSTVIATIVYGDETRVSSQSYDQGTCTGNGTHPRGNPAGCNPWASTIQSYCNAADPQCCVGGIDPPSHYTYPALFDLTATQFVVAKYQAAVAAAASKSSSSVTTTASSSSAGSATPSSSGSTTPVNPTTSAAPQTTPATLGSASTSLTSVSSTSMTNSVSLTFLTTVVSTTSTKATSTATGDSCVSLIESDFGSNDAFFCAVWTATPSATTQLVYPVYSSACTGGNVYSRISSACTYLFPPPTTTAAAPTITATDSCVSKIEADFGPNDGLFCWGWTATPSATNQYIYPAYSTACSAANVYSRISSACSSIFPAITTQAPA